MSWWSKETTTTSTGDNIGSIIKETIGGGAAFQSRPLSDDPTWFQKLSVIDILSMGLLLQLNLYLLIYMIYKCLHKSCELSWKMLSLIKSFTLKLITVVLVFGMMVFIGLQLKQWNFLSATTMHINDLLPPQLNLKEIYDYTSLFFWQVFPNTSEFKAPPQQHTTT